MGDAWDSGFKWGAFNLRGDPPWRLKIEQQGGSVIYPYPLRPKHSQHLREVNLDLPVIHKGTDYSDFSDWDQVPLKAAYYFWDNCLIPTMGKSWCRLVRGGSFPEFPPGAPPQEVIERHESRIKQQLAKWGPGQVKDHWRTLKEYQPDDVVLWAQSSPNCLKWVYHTDTDRLRPLIYQWAQQQGLRVIERAKLPRLSRQDLKHQLRQSRVGHVIASHSTAITEAWQLGLETTTLGQGPRLNDHTPDQWQQWSMICTYHKTELIDGTWSKYLEDHELYSAQRGRRDLAKEIRSLIDLNR